MTYTFYLIALVLLAVAGLYLLEWLHPSIQRMTGAAKEAKATAEDVLIGLGGVEVGIVRFGREVHVEPGDKVILDFDHATAPTNTIYVEVVKRTTFNTGRVYQVTSRGETVYIGKLSLEEDTSGEVGERDPLDAEIIGDVE